MLRTGSTPWWRRFIASADVPSYVVVRPAEARRCPECHAFYEVRDRYCPGCHTAVPEWRFG
ncbi:MAG: hypothetical protein IT303_14695 [Dehalococcoidia bacterium]|nr:hypothetical protein [Dehalococcoidia bacterium]